jgi:drug/metabolite transporter (DMT)-like permease
MVQRNSNIRSSTMPRPIAMLSLIAAMTLGGANVPFGKAIVAEIPVIAFLAIRFAIACLALAPVAPFETGPPMRSISRAQWARIGVLALFGSVLYTLFLLEGVKRTSATDAGIIMAALPAVITMLAAVGGSRVRPSQWIMVALASSGVATIAAFGSTAGFGTATPASLTGNALVAIAVVCEAVFALTARGIAGQIGPIRLSLAVSLAGLPASLLILAPHAATLGPLRPTTGVVVLCVWYALTSSVLCTILWYRGVAHVEPWAAGLSTAALPVAALAVSSLFLGEAIGWAQIVGAGLVIAAIAMGALAQRRRFG